MDNNNTIKPVPKRIAIVPFPGGVIEVRNAYTYNGRQQDANGVWQDTGVLRQARSGTYLCLHGSDPVEVSGLDLDEVLAPAIIAKLKKHPLAQKILKENLDSMLD